MYGYIEGKTRKFQRSLTLESTDLHDLQPSFERETCQKRKSGQTFHKQKTSEVNKIKSCPGEEDGGAYFLSQPLLWTELKKNKRRKPPKSYLPSGFLSSDFNSYGFWAPIYTTCVVQKNTNRIFTFRSPRLVEPLRSIAEANTNGLWVNPPSAQAPKTSKFQGTYGH